MEPWIALLIILGFIVFVIVFAVIIIVATGKSSSSGRASKRILDLSKFKTHGRIFVFKPHQDFMTKDWCMTTQNSEKALVREAGVFYKPMRELNLKDMLTLTDTESGFSLIINEVSALELPILKENRELRKKLEIEKSKASELKAQNIVLRKHIDKKVLDEVEKLGNIHQKVAPVFLKSSGRRN
jgi:arsenate reductase-like glutaredoxin family protein